MIQNYNRPVLYKQTVTHKESRLIRSLYLPEFLTSSIKSNNLNKEELADSTSVYEAPIYPGCEDMNETEKKGCFQDKINQHIIRNFRYPEIAQEMGIQGIIYVQFLLGKDGGIRGLGSSGTGLTLNQEAERIISLLPKIYPGKINGLRRVVPFNIPITFKLM